MKVTEGERDIEQLRDREREKEGGGVWRKRGRQSVKAWKGNNPKLKERNMDTGIQKECAVKRHSQRP